MAVMSKNTPNPTITVSESKNEDTTVTKTCHQCRQKRIDIVGACVTKKRDKTCPIKYCTKCLLNRYGEKLEEVALKNDWTCPKCRGNCNCSCCMKKRGQSPTGILVHTAKATGFSSVSELLKSNGSEQYVYKKKVKSENALVVSSQKLGQENANEQNNVVIKKTKKTKRKDINNVSSEVNTAEEKSSLKRLKVSDSTDITKKVLAEGKIKSKIDFDLIVFENVHKRLTHEYLDIKGNNIADKIAKIKPVLQKKEEPLFVEVKLPQGTTSITVSGFELPPEDVGNALQFLEFCSAFGKALDLRKGQAECVIRELLSGRSKRRQQHSTLTQMIIQLLTVILEDKGETEVCLSATDGSWFTAIGECLSESEVQLDCFPPEMFEKGVSEYEKFDSSKRLKLLNFLCDETLGTLALRNCIDKQNLESIERRKEAREKISAAKDKEKQLKQKLQDQVAEAVTKKKGIPLSIAEHDAIVSRINQETKEARSEMQIAIDMLSKNSQRNNDAVRTNPVESDDKGLVFWRLKSYNEEENILLQDLGRFSEVCEHEKWFAFSSEQKPELDKYISYIRMKRLRTQKDASNVLKV
ncbi:unnamed protein product [Cochlearia groenlandica]